MRLLVIFILSLFLIEGCGAQEKRLPPELPENITVYLNVSGGMSRSYKKITIDGRILEFEELKGGGQTPQKWSARISGDELAKLYKVFVENRFETIENDESKVKAYDAGSERIAISIDKLYSFGVTYGKNSPLSGKNLERYEAVRRAIYDLIAAPKKPEIPTGGENEKFIRGTWRVSGENGGHAWFLEWTFDNGNFKQTGYPPIVQEGKYRVLSAAGDKITLELYEQKGTFGEKTREIQISLDRNIDQLTISGTKGFKKRNDQDF